MALHFTKQQIDEIEQALIARAKKDTSFPGADILDGTELIPIVQNGVNKITTYAGLWNQVSKDLQEFVEEALAGKVDVVEGKELSDNNYTSEEKDKLDGIAVGANVNVQADWEASVGDAFIKNKPDLNIYATKVTVQDIQALIPTAASTDNQLADKAFVNSSIATDTSEFRGTYDTLAELMTIAANKNDYGFVRTTDDLGNTVFQRYKYNGETWLYEYSLNNSSFTAVQWAAINSGINAERVAKLDGIAAGAQVNVLEGVQVNGSDVTIANKKVNIDLTGKVDKVEGKGLSTNDFTTALKGKLEALPSNGELNAALAGKVNTVDGKGLSTNDYTTDEKNKLSGIEAGAQENVIEHIKIDGTEQAITEKTVNLPAYPDITGKADKDTTATAGNIAVFDSSGNPVGSDMSLNGTLSPVVSEAFAKLQNEIDSLRVLLYDYQLKMKAESVDVLEYKIAGMPRILHSSIAGAPSATNVPDNWDESTMNGWSGVPRFIGQLYLDKPGKKVYFAAAVTNSTNDWVVLN